MNNELNKFISKFKDFNRANHFDVEIMMGQQTGMSGEDLEKLGLLVKNVSLPSMTDNTMIVPRMDKTVSVPGGISYGTITMTFYMDDDYLPLKFYTGFIETAANPFKKNVSKDPNKALGGYIKVTQTDNRGNKVYSFKYLNPIIKRSSEITLSQDAKGEIVLYTLTFEFSDIEVL